MATTYHYGGQEMDASIVREESRSHSTSFTHDNRAIRIVKGHDENGCIPDERDVTIEEKPQ